MCSPRQPHRPWHYIVLPGTDATVFNTPDFSPVLNSDFPASVFTCWGSAALKWTASGGSCLASHVHQHILNTATQYLKSCVAATQLPPCRHSPCRGAEEDGPGTDATPRAGPPPDEETSSTNLFLPHRRRHSLPAPPAATHRPPSLLPQHQPQVRPI